ncbi:MAG: peroxiredoxin [Planctomycetota bacterium]
MVGIASSAPEFECEFYDRTKDGADEQFGKLSDKDLKGKWYCLFFYPLDFTFVCPTELVAFNEKLEDFEDRDCELLAASTDSVYSHKGWCDSHEDLAKLRYRLLADTTHSLADAFGVLKSDAGVAYRGIYLVDPNGDVRWFAVHDMSVGRNVDEVLRVLDALQTDKLCPCNWQPGEETLS